MCSYELCWPLLTNHILNDYRLCGCYQNTYAKCSDSCRSPKLLTLITVFAPIVAWYCPPPVNTVCAKGSSPTFTPWNVAPAPTIWPAGLVSGRSAVMRLWSLAHRHTSLLSDKDRAPIPALHCRRLHAALVSLVLCVPWLRCSLKKIEQRDRMGPHFSIVVMAEGAQPIGGEVSAVSKELTRKEAHAGGRTIGCNGGA